MSLRICGPKSNRGPKWKISTVNGAPYNKSERYGVMYTIPELLQVIKANVDRKPVKQTLKFNPTYGYPTSVFFDFSEMIADEEISYYIKDLKPLK